MAEEIKAGEQGAGEQIDYKAELEKFKTENENLKKTNEDMRLEFMGDDYLNFLETKNKPADKKEETKSEQQPTIDFSKLTQEKFAEFVRAEADKIAESKVKKLQDDLSNEAKQRTKADVVKFFSNNPDAEKFRPVMYGLATDPKHSDKNLDELLRLAKSHVKSLNEGATEEEKLRSKKSVGEKPGFSSSSFKPGDKKMSSQEASEKAWEETAAKSGLF